MPTQDLDKLIVVDQEKAHFINKVAHKKTKLRLGVRLYQSSTDAPSDDHPLMQLLASTCFRSVRTSLSKSKPAAEQNASTASEFVFLLGDKIRQAKETGALVTSLTAANCALVKANTSLITV